MTTSDDAAPFPDHVVGGGKPDPVVATAPQAPPARDDADPVDDLIDSEGVPIYPITGAQTGAIPPPAPPR